MANKKSEIVDIDTPIDHTLPDITLLVTNENVVESIPTQELQHKHASVCLSPDSTKLSPNNSKPSSARIEPILSLRRTISQPKSRFGEPALPIDSALADIESDVESDQPSVECSPSPSSYRNNIAFPFASVTPCKSWIHRGDVESVTGDEVQKAEVQLNATLNQKKKGYKLVLQLVVFSCTIGCLVASLTLRKFKGYTWCGFAAWKWLVLLLVVFSGMLAIRWVVKLIVFLIQWKLFEKKNAVYMTQGLRTSVEVLIWIAMVLAAWAFLFKPEFSPKKKNMVECITWSIVSVLIGAIMWVIKTAMLKMLASSFHLNRFFADRILNSLFHHYVLETLSGPPALDIGSPFMDKKMVRLGKFPWINMPTSTVELLAHVVSNSGLSTMQLRLPEDVVERGVETDGNEIKNEEEALATAVDVFKNVAKFDRRYIEKDDLRRFISKEEVYLILPSFEVNRKGQITRRAFVKWVIKAYNFRMALVHALADTRKTFQQLNRFVDGILIFVIFMIWLVLVNTSTRKIILIISTQIVAAAFIFGESCKKLFESVIFVFVVHPYDVGDCCVIDYTPVMIEEMNILTTVVLKSNHERVSYPNSVLATKPITNYTRSPDMGDTIEFSIDLLTPVDKIQKLESEVKSYIDGTSCHWHPDHSLVVKEIEDMKKLRMVLRINHTINFHEFVERSKRKSVLIMELKKIFEKLQINAEGKSSNDC